VFPCIVTYVYHAIVFQWSNGRNIMAVVHNAFCSYDNGSVSAWIGCHKLNINQLIVNCFRCQLIKLMESAIVV